jgi:hypothetical protein
MAVVASAMALQACANSDPALGPLLSQPGSPTDTEEPSNTGSVSLALTAGGNVTFNTVHYQITRAAYSRSGVFDVSKSTTISGIIPTIPVAAGYSLALSTSAVATKRAFNCSGSSRFDTLSGAVTPVAVNLECHEVTAPVPIPWQTVPILALLLGAAGVWQMRRRAQT